MFLRMLPLLAIIAYGLAFTRLYQLLGPGAESFATVVVLLAAAQRGLVAGLLAALFCLGLHLVLGELVLGIDWRVWLQGGSLATAMGLALVGAVVGRLRDLRVRLDTEITSRKATEVQLIETQRIAEAANLAKSEFLARMSHEIRTPMHGVLGVTQVLSETRLNPEQLQYLDMIQNSGELLLAVINDILDFSKIEAGRMDLDEVEFELLPVLREPLDLIGLSARKKGLTVRLEVPEDLPLWLVGDPVRLRQVLMNLLGNAAKFTERGGLTLRVKLLTAAAPKVRLRVEVKDSGIGMEPQVMARIFDAFFQADASTTRVYGGTGLGLAISSKLVRLMGGQLLCESEVGKGSTFFFEIDLTAADAAPAEDAAPLLGAHAVSGRVLVAEDNRINQVIATRLLETLGLTVDVVADGGAAVEAAGRIRYDVVLLDCQMPVLDGFEAARQIRAAEKDGRRVPMLAVTASVLPEDHARAERRRRRGVAQTFAGSGVAAKCPAPSAAHSPFQPSDGAAAGARGTAGAGGGDVGRTQESRRLGGGTHRCRSV